VILTNIWLGKQLIDPFLGNTNGLWSTNSVNLLGHALLPYIQHQLFNVLWSQTNQYAEEEVALYLLHILKLPLSWHIF